MGTSSSEGEGDYLMPWSRVLNWNRLPGELSSSLFLSLFLRPPSPLAGSPTSHLFPSSTSLRTASAFLVFSPPFFFLHLSIYYRPSSASPPRVLRTFLGGAERSLIADGRTSRPRDRIGNEGQKFADPPLYTWIPWQEREREERIRGKKAKSGEEDEEGRERERFGGRVTGCS